MLACNALLLATPSKAYVSAHLTRTGIPISSRVVGTLDRIHQEDSWHLQRSLGVFGDSLPQSTDFKCDRMKAVARLRGGSPLMAMGSGDVAISLLDTLRSASDVVPLGGGALFLQVCKELPSCSCKSPHSTLRGLCEHRVEIKT